jgi:hypothetical protein
MHNNAWGYKLVLLVMTCSPRVKTSDEGSSVPESGCQLESRSLNPKALLVVNLRVRLLVREVCVNPPESCW